MNYENEICQGCGKIMQKEDDIVVCPQCGTPQHRECYKAENRCVNHHLHEDGYEWHPRHSKAEESDGATKEEGKSKICPFCRHENREDAEQCENCGQPFQLFGRSIFPSGEQNYPGIGGEKESSYTYKPPFEVEEPTYSEKGYRAPIGGTSSEKEGEAFNFNGFIMDEKIGETENRDLALYLRSSVPVYYKKFRKLRDGGKSFNWAAFIFCPYWFFYRKLIKPGIILVSLSLLLSVLFYNPITSYLDVMYSSSQSLMSELSGMTEEELAALTEEEIAAIGEEYRAIEEKTAEVMPYVMLYGALLLAMHIGAGFLADRMYKKKTEEDIRQVARDIEALPNYQQEKYLAYMKKGGTSIGFPLIAYGAEYIIFMLINSIIGM